VSVAELISHAGPAKVIFPGCFLEHGNDPVILSSFCNESLAARAWEFFAAAALEL
jgi:hypothetical protein